MDLRGSATEELTPLYGVWPGTPQVPREVMEWGSIPFSLSMLNS